MRTLRLAKHEQAARTRTRLLEAAGDLFAVRGYDDTTIDDICLAASRARGAFYVHFRSRNDVFLAALRADGARPRLLLDALARAAHDDPDAQELRKVLGAILPGSDDLSRLIALGRSLWEAGLPAPAVERSRRGRAA